MSDSSSPQARVRQACDPCRRKKVRCPGERPSCSFCSRLSQRCSYSRSSLGPGFRVEKDRNGLSSQDEGRIVEGYRVQRLEARVDQIMDAVNTLVQLQSGSESTGVRLPAPATPRPSGTPNEPDESDDNGLSGGTRFNTMQSPDPPSAVLQSLVELYINRIADQPLPLFDIRALPTNIRKSSKLLYNSFLALTVRYCNLEWYSNAQASAAAFYKNTASEMLFAMVADATIDLETLQAFSLLCMCEIADGNMRRAWMVVGVATRLAMCSGLMAGLTKRTPMSAEHSRCCWSLFLLDRIHGTSFRFIPAISTEDLLPDMPPSLQRPASLELTSQNDTEEYQGAGDRDAGINSYALRLLSIWGRLMSYLKTIKHGVLEEDAWAANSSYQQIKSEMSRFETVLPEVHRFKNTRFRDMNIQELEKNRHYWASWVFTQCIYHTIHCTLNHPFLHIARIPGRKTLRSPSFLQHTTDQALLHSAWVVLILSSCEERQFGIHDPFVGHLASIIASAQFLLQFSKDETLAAKAYRSFGILRNFVEQMALAHPHLLHTVSKLNRLAQFATAHLETSANQPPKVETALLWDLLDYAVSASPPVDVGETSDNVELNVNTQFLSDISRPPLAASSSTAPGVNSNEAAQDAYSTNLWDNATFEFDMAEFSNLADFSGMPVSNEGWIGGHL